MSFEGDDGAQYQVVVNPEDQYSIWPADRALPLGWRAEGKTGTKQECLDHIAALWTDTIPRGPRGR
ncbi:MbtH family protein [Myxococcota bacterium]|nr:MbtH family protein [Myxococcota bacterium]